MMSPQQGSDCGCLFFSLGREGLFSYNESMKERTLYRYAEERDLPALTGIYNHYILNSTATFDLNPCEY